MQKITKTLSLSIVARFMSEEELEQFAQEYNAHRLRAGWIRFQPSKKEWEMYHDPKVSLADWRKHWKQLKHKEAVIRRLGQMTLLRQQMGKK